MNMSYCRFQNTLMDLKDCVNHIYDADLSLDERVARDELLQLCTDITDARIKRGEVIISTQSKEREAVEVKERKCKHCGAITKRTLYGLCSACCRFN